MERVRLLAFLAAAALTVWFGSAGEINMRLPWWLSMHGEAPLHVIAFAGLALIALAGRTPWFRPVLILACLAVFLEVAQVWIPGRGANFADLGASLAGILVGLIAALALTRIVRRIIGGPGQGEVNDT